MSISGTPAVGNTLTCKATVTTTAAETVTYQWTRDTVAIAGATAPTYLVAVADETHHLACAVTVSGDGGSATSTSGYDGVPAESGGTVSESVVEHLVRLRPECGPVGGVERLVCRLGRSGRYIHLSLRRAKRDIFGQHRYFQAASVKKNPGLTFCVF